ncbi:MAG: aspartate carbamoyltransferase catalytic subunit [Solirubrobacterales bacterium]
MRNLLGIADLNRAQIERLLDRAESLTQLIDRENKKLPTLSGRTIVNLFFENSTRTSSSFDLAAKRLSADTVTIRAIGSSVEKGESLRDTVQTLSAYGPSAIVVRSPFVGAPGMVTRWTDAAVINAGDGKHEHPTQALLDAYTLRRRIGDLDDKSVWIIGDVLHSRVARSNILALTKLGAEVTVCGPPTLIPREIEALGCQVSYSLTGSEDADVLYVLRMQNERMRDSYIPSIREYAARYQINADRLGARQLLMHPGPVNRGVELSPDVVDAPQSLITQQVASGVVVRMAVFYELMAGRGEPEGGDRQAAAVAPVPTEVTGR